VGRLDGVECNRKDDGAGADTIQYDRRGEKGLTVKVE